MQTEECLPNRIANESLTDEDDIPLALLAKNRTQISFKENEEKKRIFVERNNRVSDPTVSFSSLRGIYNFLLLKDSFCSLNQEHVASKLDFSFVDEHDDVTSELKPPRSPTIECLRPIENDCFTFSTKNLKRKLAL